MGNRSTLPNTKTNGEKMNQDQTYESKCTVAGQFFAQLNKIMINHPYRLYRKRKSSIMIELKSLVYPNSMLRYLFQSGFTTVYIHVPHRAQLRYKNFEIDSINFNIAKSLEDTNSIRLLKKPFKIPNKIQPQPQPQIQSQQPQSQSQFQTMHSKDCNLRPIQTKPRREWNDIQLEGQKFMKIPEIIVIEEEQNYDNDQNHSNHLENNEMDDELFLNQLYNELLKDPQFPSCTEISHYQISSE